MIQFSLECYRFYIYGKRPKINIFGNDRCTPAWAAIVLLVGFATLLIFQRVKFNDSLFFSMDIVIFCTYTKLLPYLLQVAILSQHIKCGIYHLALTNSIASFPDRYSIENSIIHKSFHSFSISALRPVSLSLG